MEEQNQTLFNITNTTSPFEVWKPRFSLVSIAIMISIPTITAWIFFIFCFKRVWKGGLLIYSKSKREKEEMKCFDYVVNGYIFFKTFVISLIKNFVDVLDIMFDLYMFYQLEYGDILNKNIYRNSQVNNAIYAFAFLGVLRMIRWRGFARKSKNTSESEIENEMGVRTSVEIVAGFLIEDGPEMILEYFYVEKYLTKSAVWYLLVRDAILGLLYCYSLYKSLKVGVNNCDIRKGGVCCRIKYLDGKIKNNANSTKYIVGAILFIYTTYGYIFICAPLIGISQILRVVGATLQYTLGEVNPKCFHIQDGKLLQTPFQTECMSWIDWTILASTCTVLLVIVLASFITSIGIYYIVICPEKAEAKYWKYIDNVERKDNTTDGSISQHRKEQENLQFVTAV